jgi:hypothetical protein
MTTFWPKRDEDGRHMSEPKPLSELLAKLDPDVVERARADADNELKCAKCDGYQIIALDGEIYNCECTE